MAPGPLDELVEKASRVGESVAPERWRDLSTRKQGEFAYAFLILVVAIVLDLLQYEDTVFLAVIGGMVAVWLLVRALY